MRALLFGLVVCLTLAACSDDDDGSAPTVSEDPAALLAAAETAMEEADSYHAVIVSTPDRNPLDQTTSEVDYAGEDLTRAIVTYLTGESGQSCQTGTDSTGSSFQRCDSVLETVTEEYSSDTISVPSGYYFRSCDNGDCGGWGFAPADDRQVRILVLTADRFGLESLPNLLEHAVNPEIVSAGGNGLIHISAGFSPIRLALEEQRTLFEELDIEGFGESCESTGSITFGSDGADTAPQEDSECQQFTLEDYVEANETEIERYDEHPSTFNIWISPDDFTVRRLEFQVPEAPIKEPGESDIGFFDDSTVTVTMEFTSFGDIEVEIPTLDLN